MSADRVPLRRLPERVSFGPLAAAVADPEATDVFLNPDGSVWVDHGDGARPVPGLRVPAGEARELAVRLVAAGGRHLDDATPAADVRIGGGIRVHGVLPPISPDAAVVSIRLPRDDGLDLDALEARGMFASVPRALVDDLVRRRANVLVTGAGGSGKTTLLGAMLASAPAAERLVVVEDVAELRIPHPHVVRLEARQPNLEGAGAVGLDRLVREALRMRPDRLVVGECRGAELRELLTALNTGHDGGAGTLHANSLGDVPARLEALGALAGWSASALARQAVSAVDAVLQLGRSPDGTRGIREAGRLRLTGRGRLVAEPT
ncbi:TadA family conjugal transfer-associated ATPase [Protaetiibacter sp. 10F1B-8-1]|uniref:TadA family conjugal transfer-associated ATPase n=2 Tax=Protaetiibacter mangrovi TaxID=2970926 RepID=A0ABT1ZFU1_9MICO|nr:TadA family conjugal transfer-associated ATPase [Protaetiibacter mangrovi]MCS0499577.1 TadA family conjugal transfer-associated ATPase [Protaetiibacter mangrovi]